MIKILFKNFHQKVKYSCGSPESHPQTSRFRRSDYEVYCIKQYFVISICLSFLIQYNVICVSVFSWGHKDCLTNIEHFFKKVFINSTILLPFFKLWNRGNKIMDTFCHVVSAEDQLAFDLLLKDGVTHYVILKTLYRRETKCLS
jgi:hypothetical protein